MAPAYPDISPTVFYVSHGDGVRTIQYFESYYLRPLKDEQFLYGHQE